MPSDIEGIVILNIASYGSGMNLWGSNPISLDEEGRDLESSFSYSVRSNSLSPSSKRSEKGDGARGRSKDRKEGASEGRPRGDSNFKSDFDVSGPSSLNDGLLDIVAIPSAISLGLAGAGLQGPGAGTGVVKFLKILPTNYSYTLIMLQGA